MRSPDDWAAWQPSDKNDLAKIIHDNYSPYDGYNKSDAKGIQ